MTQKAAVAQQSKRLMLQRVRQFLKREEGRGYNEWQEELEVLKKLMLKKWIRRDVVLYLRIEFIQFCIRDFILSRQSMRSAEDAFRLNVIHDLWLRMILGELDTKDNAPPAFRIDEETRTNILRALFSLVRTNAHLEDPCCLRQHEALIQRAQSGDCTAVRHYCFRKTPNPEDNPVRARAALG